MLIERPDDKTVEVIKKYLDDKSLKYEEIDTNEKSEVA